MENNTKFSIWYVLAAIWGVLLIQDFIASQYRPIALPYSEFLKSLQAGDIIEVVITQDRISGKMKVTDNQQTREVNFVTIRVDPELSNELAKHNVRFRGQPESTFLRDLLSWTLPALIFFGIWYLVMKRLNPGAGIMTFGRNKAKL